MDTSKTYIKMHLALPMKEEPREGDYFYDPDSGHSGKMGEVYFDTSKMIKLYEQDQLQEMVGTKDAFLLLKYFSDWGLSSDRCKNRDFLLLSMEQLWLAFYMKENHNKVWLNEWIIQ